MKNRLVKKYCCLIGGTGFIGSTLVKLLLSSGRKVMVIGRNPVPSRSLPQGIRYISHDYGDQTFWKHILKDINEIIHLAHSVNPETSINKFCDKWKDLQSSQHLFDLASNFPLKKIIYTSSGGTVYGNVLKLPITEKHPTNPISPYGISKLAIEKYGMMCCDLHKLPFICLRPGNVFGEQQRPFSKQGFIATAIASILLNRTVTIFGIKDTIRDYLYVDDMVNGIMAALDNGTIGKCYNVGSGIGRDNQTVINTLTLLAQNHGLKVKVQIKPRRNFDVKANVLDSTKLTQDTGWKAKASFEEGVKRTWDWFCRNNLQHAG